MFSCTFHTHTMTDWHHSQLRFPSGTFCSVYIKGLAKIQICQHCHKVDKDTLIKLYILPWKSLKLIKINHQASFKQIDSLHCCLTLQINAILTTRSLTYPLDKIKNSHVNYFFFLSNKGFISQITIRDYKQ